MQMEQYHRKLARCLLPASEAGLECIEIDIHLSLDSQLPMIHDNGLGRSTDVGEYTGTAAYDPYMGKGYNSAVKDMNFTGFMEHLHLRDEAGRVHVETISTLPDMVTKVGGTLTCHQWNS
jgi:glycerophosphoryl diester phosphodiesterase